MVTRPAVGTGDVRRGLPWLAAILVGLVALGLSVWRVMPGLGFWDTAEFQMVPPVMGTAHPTGYPTYVLLGWLASIVLAPLGEAAFRMNVLSAVLVGVGSGFTADLARRLSGSIPLGIMAGIGTALTPIVWAIGTHADPHALHFAFVAIILWLLVRWEHARRGDPLAEDEDDGAGAGADDGAGGPRTVVGRERGAAAPRAAGRHADRLLVAAAVVVGLAVGNHSLILLFGPPILLFVLAVEPGIARRPRLVAASIAAFAIPTVLVRFEMILRAGWFRAPFVYADPSTWSGFWYVTLGEQFHGWLTSPLANGPKRIADLLAIAAGQFGPLAVVIVAALVVTIVRQPRYALLSGSALALTCFFNSVYPDGAIDRYYIGPALIVWTWLAILGRTIVDIAAPQPEHDDDRTGRPRGSDDPAVAGRRPVAPGWRAAARPLGLLAAALLLLAPSLLALPARAGSQAVNQSTNDVAIRWTDEVLSALEPNAVVISWWSYSTPLWYATIVDHRRPDILIIDDRDRVNQNLGEIDQVIDLYIATRPVYLIRNGTFEFGRLVGRYNVDSIGAPLATNVLRVIPVAAASR